MHFSFSAGGVLGDSLYFSENTFNGLFKLDLTNDEILSIGFFPDEDLSLKKIHKHALVYKGMIVFVPNSGNHVHIYDPNKDKIISIRVNKVSSGGYEFSEGVIFGDKLFIMPGNLEQPIITLDLTTYYSSCIDIDLSNYCMDRARNDQLFCKAILYGSEIWTPLLKSSKIFRYSILDNKIYVEDVGISNLYGIYKTTEDVWLTTLYSGIVRVDNRFNTIEVVSNKSETIQTYIVMQNNDMVYYIPDMGGKILLHYEGTDVCDLKPQSIEVQMIKNERTVGGVYDYGCIYRDGIIVYPRYESQMVLIGRTAVKPIIPRMTDFKKFIQCSGYGELLKRTMLTEGSLLGLEEYIEMV